MKGWTNRKNWKEGTMLKQNWSWKKKRKKRKNEKLDEKLDEK